MRSILRQVLPFVALFASACQLVYGNGEAASEDRTSDAFDRVENLGALPVTVVVGGANEVTLECDENLLEYIDTEVVGGILRVAVEDGVSIEPRTRCRLTAYTPSLIGVESEGSGELRVEGAATPLASVNLIGSGGIVVDADIEIAELAIDAYGSGRVTLESVNAESATIRHEGSGGVFIRGGAVDELVIDQDGSGDVHTQDLDAARATVDLYGSGSVYVFASEHSEVRVEGSGSVFVRGSPESRDEVIQGSGDIFYE